MKQCLVLICMLCLATVQSYSQSLYNATSVSNYRNEHKLQYGHLRISNEQPSRVTVNLYHPDNPDGIFATYVFSSNSISNFMYNNDAINIASDWGISFSDETNTSAIYFAGDKAQYTAGIGFMVKEFSIPAANTKPEPAPSPNPNTTRNPNSISPTIADQPGLTQQQFLDFKTAKQLMASGDYAGAARLLQGIKNPDYPNAFLENMLIQCYTKTGDYVAAAEEQKLLAKVGKYAGKIATAAIQSTAKANNNIMATDSLAFAAAKKTNTIEGYQKYLNSKYHSRYEENARSMIDYLNYQNAKKENTESSYSRYLSNFPNGKYVADAKTDINTLVQQSNNYYVNQYNQARQNRAGYIKRLAITEAIGVGSLAVGIGVTVEGDPNSSIRTIAQIIGFTVGTGAVIGGLAGGIGPINYESSKMESNKSKIRPLPYSLSFRVNPSFYCYQNNVTPSLSIKIGF